MQPVPHIFGSRVGNIHLSELDTNFSTVVAAVTVTEQNLAAEVAKTTLGPMASAVQTLIDAASVVDRNLANATGQLSASNVVLASSEVLQARLDRLDIQLTQLLGTAPVNTVQPAAPSGTKTVGQTLTAGNGTWTGASTFSYVWYRVHKTSGAISAVGAVGASYVQQPADYDYFMAVAVTAYTASGVASAPVMSAVTTAVSGGVLPTNSVAPSISPSGSQAAGTTLTWDVGSWANAATYVVDIYAGGSIWATTQKAAATTGTFIPINAEVGLGMTIKVTGYNALGVPIATAVDGSNTVTITGTLPTLVQVTQPTWPANLYLEVSATLAEGVWNFTPDSIIHNFYKNGGTTPFRSANTGLLFTPHAAPHPDGIVAGDSIVYDSIPTYQGITYAAYRSTAKVVSATPAGLAITPSAEAGVGYTWTQGSAIATATLGTITGGTAPYTLTSILSSGASMPSTLAGSVSGGVTLLVTGAPGVTLSSRVYTVTVTDAVGATTTMTFTAQVNAAGASPLDALTYPVPLIVTGASGDYNGSTPFSNANAFIGPAGDGYMDIHRVINAGLGSGTERRAELGWLGTNWIQLICQHEYWWSFVVERIAGETQPASGPDDAMLVFQTHWAGYGDTSPEVALIERGQDDMLRWRVSGSSLTPGNYADHGGSGTNNWHDAPEVTPWMHAGDARPAAGVKWRYIVRYKPGWTAGHDKHVQIWRARPGEAFANICSNYSGDYTGINAYNDNNNGASLSSYPRKGIYKWNGSTWNVSPIGYKLSKIYFGEGAGLYDRAEAAVSWAA